MWIKVINEDSEKLAVEMPDNELKSLQLIVGGYIEVVRISKDELMIVNEEGAITGDWKLNRKASVLAGTAIFGNVAIVRAAGEDFGYYTETEAKEWVSNA